MCIILCSSDNGSKEPYKIKSAYCDSIFCEIEHNKENHKMLILKKNKTPNIDETEHKDKLPGRIS
jgi:hypothetical protein